MDAREIFELIVKADEALKYATDDKLEARTRQARELLERAAQEARAAEQPRLVELAERRIADLRTVGRGTD